MTSLLERTTLSYWKRGGLDPMRTPGVAHDGPKVMLINGYSSSGGDAFPYYLRKKDWEPSSVRAHGAVWWVFQEMHPWWMEASISVPRFGIYDENEKWIIEGIGVYPDIRVILIGPNNWQKGQDPSIEKAVEVLLKQLEETR
jgi:tricorn protease